MADPLRVTHVVLSLDVGGLERNVINQVRQAPALGEEVSILCIERPGSLAQQAQSLGARVLCTEKQPGLRLGTIARIRHALKQLRPHVLHTHQIGPLFYAGPAARSLRVPLIVHTEHGREDYARRWRTRLLGRLAARYVEVFYCLTEDMAHAVKASRIVSADRVRVIHNGIDIDCYRQPCDTAAVRHSLGIPADAPVIGTVGRLNEIKRQDLLLRAFAGVKQQVPSAHLVLVGDGPLMTELQELAAQLGLRHSTHFAGYQSPTSPYLQAMDIFALTSRSEGMPQALLEACVAAKPVIASCVGGIPEVIEHGRTGLLCKVGDQAALTAGLLRLLDQPDLRRQLGVAARARVESLFDIGRMAADYHRDFLQILQRKGQLPNREPACVA